MKQKVNKTMPESFIPRNYYRKLARESKGLNINDFFPEESTSSCDILDTLKDVAIVIYDPEVHTPAVYLDILYQVSLEFGDFVTSESAGSDTVQSMWRYWNKKSENILKIGLDERFQKRNKMKI
jgi:hypothetical protein